MKAVIIFHDNTDKAIEGKDLHIHLDAPGAYHLTDAFYNHKLIGAFSSVREIRLEGKPKQKKVKPPETLTIEVDTTKLQACIKETMLELEGLADSERFIHKEDIDDDYIDRNCSSVDLTLYGLDMVRVERDQLQKEVNELRDQLQQLAFVPPDVATAAKLLDCTCPPKRNIIDRGHLSYCPAYEGKADCEARPVKC